HPERFDLEYVGGDNKRHRPIMLHRALFGSIERFFGVLLEHYAGNLPTWLSPEQVRVLGVRDAHDAYASEVASVLRASGVRVGLDEASEPLGARIRRAKLDKIPYVVVVGDDDLAHDTVGVNARGSNTPERGVSVMDFRDRLVREISDHGAPEAP
ncbi:MAG TPA: His/Gly/Thr/Pro-type tRNA ligase C-terminal domain-containing protein, partial [Acidimicrobiales bacterium]|nr:His/Gly/Thr/Pro-type tRNA ligase C-terminal domain-containing protein [Acidimicrobiales bacterium]